MQIITKIIAIALLLSVTTAQQCPPSNFDAVDTLDINGFIDKRWYSIKQIVVPYQPLSQFYCVTAQYGLKTTQSIYCRLFGCKDRPTITVFNSARRRDVKGRVTSIRFEATVTDPANEPAKAQVVPTFFPNFLRNGSNYWIVAAGTWEDLAGVDLTVSGRAYDWAIITTGQPESKGTDGCYSDGGMWLFSKVPNPADVAVDAIEVIAKDLGLDTSKWLPVEHDGCTYA
jgi:lipocalin